MRWPSWLALLVWICTGVVSGQSVESVATAFARQPMVFAPHVFSGETFPPCDFADSLLARRRIGPYTIEVDFYDRNYRRVTAPTEAGRYGAVVTVRASSGRTYRRFKTLYRHVAPVVWDPSTTVPLVDLPYEMAIDPIVIVEQGAALSAFVIRQVVRGLTDDEQAGALFAGLHELVPGTGGIRASQARDRTWWVGLKRRLYDLEPAEAFDCPTAVYRGRSTELTFGSPSEAGMRETVTAALDSVLAAWQSDEPLSLCVARKGVVFYYRAVGGIGSRPMTLATQTPLAEVTEVLAGLALMTLVDQKRVELDAPVAKYLVPLRGTALDPAMTVRHLVTHTSGIADGWRDDINDLEERVAGVADDVEVGGGGASSSGMALVGKVIEAVSGEALDAFYRDHLLSPLACDDTEVFGTHDDAWSVPLDLAKLGQLLLNGGSYGDFLFIEPETAQAMTGVRGVRGIGIVPKPGEGLGTGSYGRDGVTGSSFRVDPANAIVIALHRFSGGEDGASHRRVLFRTIAEHVVPGGS